MLNYFGSVHECDKRTDKRKELPAPNWLVWQTCGKLTCRLNKSDMTAMYVHRYTQLNDDYDVHVHRYNNDAARVNNYH